MRHVPNFWLPVCTLALIASGSATIAAGTLSAAGIKLTYDGISAGQARALSDTLSAARTIYTDDFTFDMPQTITLVVSCAAGNPTRLFNDGRDHIDLSIASPESLFPPAKSGAFHLYGLCHELGHIAMYRVLKDRDWLTGAGAEGWAHFAGSVVVDGVYTARGDKLWSPPYDYRGDGTPRLEKQLKSASPTEIDRAAGHWRDLDAIIGHKQFPKLFGAWQSAQPDPAAPADKLLPALLDAFPGKKDSLQKWWQSAAPLLVRVLPKSGFARVTIEPARLEGKPLLLKGDDDAPDGKRSIAGGGHARLFEAPLEGQWYIRSVSIHGARYGPVAAPPDQFDIALCDADMRPIALWKHPYKSFDRGQAKWVRFDLPPTLVPPKFNICAVFRPTAQNGVFVDYDTSTSGNSSIATPGAPGDPLKQGDWMIRVELDRPKATDALRDH
jgi:hypothetical protein